MFKRYVVLLGLSAVLSGFLHIESANGRVTAQSEAGIKLDWSWSREVQFNAEFNTDLAGVADEMKPRMQDHRQRRYIIGGRDVAAPDCFFLANEEYLRCGPMAYNQHNPGANPPRVPLGYTRSLSYAGPSGSRVTATNAVSSQLPPGAFRGGALISALALFEKAANGSGYALSQVLDPWEFDLDEEEEIDLSIDLNEGNLSVNSDSSEEGYGYSSLIIRWSLQRVDMIVTEIASGDRQWLLIGESDNPNQSLSLEEQQIGAVRQYLPAGRYILSVSLETYATALPVPGVVHDPGDI